MPWTTHNYPASMKRLNARVKAKAIEIGNALLAEGYAEDHAIPIAIATAKKWADNHTPSERITADQRLHVVSHPRGWAVRRARAERAAFVFEDKTEAQSKALALANETGVSVVIHGEDGHIEGHIIPI